MRAADTHHAQYVHDDVSDIKQYNIIIMNAPRNIIIDDKVMDAVLTIIVIHNNVRPR